MNLITVRFLLTIILVASALAQKPNKVSDIPVPDPNSPYDWGIVYYMSYDNNLNSLGKDIIEEIGKGVKSPRTVAAVQADFSDRNGMHRYTISSSGTKEERVASEDSADEEQFISYLDWFVNSFPSKRYIIIFLNHGGGLDEMCLDERSDTKGKSWMSGRVLGEKLRKFKPKMQGDWPLLFLQQCGRGSIENLYSFRGTADFIMSSPVNVGAPNTYYNSLHQWLAENPSATGNEIAAKISKEDQDYKVYTCVKTSELNELPHRLDAAIAPFLKSKVLKPPTKSRVIYSANGEVTYDAKQFLEQLAVDNDVETASVEVFLKWTRERLFTNVWFRDEQKNRAILD